MKTKLISLSLLSLSISAAVMATDYKSPNVGLRETAPATQTSKMMEFNEEYKVEPAIKAERQIASEEESRGPSSVVAADKKFEEEGKKEGPKQWLFKNDH